MDWIKRHWFKVALFALVGVFGTIFIMERLGSGGSNLPDLGEAPAFALQNIEGETVKLDDAKGEVRLVYFYFASCPDVCLATTYQLSQVQNSLKEANLFGGGKTSLFSITFDPARDTPEQLKKFSEAYGVDASGWSFLRGEQQVTDELVKSYGILVAKDGDNFIHSNRITLIDKNGKIRQRYDASTIDPEQIVQDMKALIKA